MTGESNGRLVSWKEIAAYLGCDVRTCMRWEKERSLPVHRPGGQPGPRVIAWKHELDDWLAGKPRQEAAVSPEADAIAPSVERGSISRAWAFTSVLIIAAIALAYLGIRHLTRDREPADFHIDGSRLIIMNKEGKELWPFETGFKDLWPEEKHREKFQKRQIDSTDPDSGIQHALRLAFEDLDGDGRKEVLYAPHSEKGTHSRRIFCFDRRGRPRWPAPFEGGRELTFGTKSYSRDYFSFFETLDLDGDGRLEILVISDHNSDWPTQLAVLSADGRVLGEYWNSGRITSTAVADLNGDGRPELILGGTNAEYAKAFLAIFDPRRISGASPNTGEFRSPALAAGSELAYILLPLTDIDPHNDIHAVLSLVEVLDNGRLRGQISRTSLQYEIDPHSLACLDVTYSIRFKQIHEQAVRAGTTRSRLDDKSYTENLKRGFLYWTGREWTSTPTWIAP